MSDVLILFDKLKHETEDGGYLLNPDKEFVLDLIDGLMTNEKRYGYQSCPCRLAEGKKELDLDIICPCDYRDPDLNEYGACYCALYVSQEWIDGKQAQGSIPERRQKREQEQTVPDGPAKGDMNGLKFPVWRCRVCGYLCAREEPPGVCPVCKAKKERFEIFMQ